MKVMKFGGTSVGKPVRMHEVARLITAGEGPRLVVLSAVSGTTNMLVEIGHLLASGERGAAKEKIDALEAQYVAFAGELVQSIEARDKAASILREHFEFLNIILRISYSEALSKDILAQGELLSTKLFSTYLDEQGIRHALLPALEFMHLDDSGEPAVEDIRQRLNTVLARHDEGLYITQGFICRNARGEVDNLRRGGSDYSASLMAAALKAEVCEIWTDISGMHNNDPRVVERTVPISRLSFDEAAELAYFGAKILHPASIWPAQQQGVPVRLLNTMEPEAEGTLISSTSGGTGVKAVAAKDGIIAVNIRSSRMLLAYGFLRKVFEVFEKHRTPIDMITTSEVAVSLTIDSDTALDAIQRELGQYGTVEVERNYAIVSVVGQDIAGEGGTLQSVFNSLQDISVRMVSYGGSPHNISILVPADQKTAVLRQLNSGVFGLH